MIAYRGNIPHGRNAILTPAAGGVPTFAEHQYATRLRRHDAFVAGAEPDPDEWRRTCPAGDRRHGGHPDLRELPLEKISAPTLIITARDDGFNTLPAATFAARRIPNATLITYDTGGHLLVGHGDAVRSAIGDFVATVLAADCAPYQITLP
jgi:pimeloyl-ACP methyl ester carboxylesterase